MELDRITIASMLTGLLIVPGSALAVESATSDPIAPAPIATSQPVWVLGKFHPSREKLRLLAEARKRAEHRAFLREQATFTPEYSQAYARRILGQRYGWGESQYFALLVLWTRESSWDHTAKNPSSGAYGIPQSLPASKMAANGDNWRTDPRVQIRWGLRYIHDTYGTPAAALAHSDLTGWY